MARKLRVMDFVFVAAVAGVIVFLFLRLGRNLDDSKKRLVVQSSFGGEYVFPLDRDGLYNVAGLHGDSVIEVLDGKARFKDSPCPNKTCVQQGFISLQGEYSSVESLPFIISGEKEEEETVNVYIFIVYNVYIVDNFVNCLSGAI